MFEAQINKKTELFWFHKIGKKVYHVHLARQYLLRFTIFAYTPIEYAHGFVLGFVVVICLLIVGYCDTYNCIL